MDTVRRERERERSETEVCKERGRGYQNVRERKEFKIVRGRNVRGRKEKKRARSEGENDPSAKPNTGNAKERRKETSFCNRNSSLNTVLHCRGQRSEVRGQRLVTKKHLQPRERF